MTIALVRPVSPAKENSALPKLPAPFLRRGVIERRLLEGSYRLRLLLAPPGYGKTSMMVTCAHSSASRVLWIELQGREATFDEIVQLIGDQLQPGSGSWTEAQLVKALQTHQSPLAIMLDDWPRAINHSVDTGIGRLLGILSNHLEWWVTSRRRLNCNFARLILQGEYLEVGIDELALSKSETLSLATLHDKRTGERASQIHEASQGWPAAVTFHCRPTNYQCADVSISQLLNNYLHHETVECLPPLHREMLLGLCRIELFNKSLCEHLWGSASTNVLDELIRCGIPIMSVNRLGKKWMQILPPMARSLAEYDSTDYKSLHRQACQFFIVQNEKHLAIEHAVAAEQIEVAASLIEQLSEEELITPEICQRLIAYRDLVPNELVECTPRLASVYALTYAITNRLSESQTCLAALDKFFPFPNQDEQEYLIALGQGTLGIIEHCKGNSEAAVDLCRQALDTLSNRNSLVRFAFWPILIQQHLFLGNLSEADRQVQLALQASQTRKESWPQSLIVFYQSLLMESRGQLLSALNILDREIISQEQSDTARNVAFSRLTIRRAYIYMQLGRLKEARRGFSEGIHLCEGSFDPYAIHGHIGLFKLDLAEARVEEAAQKLSEAERWLNDSDITASIFRDDFYQCKTLLMSALDDPNSAQSTLRLMSRAATKKNRQCLPFHTAAFRYETDRLIAKVQSRHGRSDAALQSLADSLECATQSGFALAAIEIRLTIAEIQLSLGHEDLATEQAKIAIQACESLEYRLPLEMLAHRRSPLLTPSSSSNLLSRREIEVLRLIEAGHSNQEIADRLVLSIFTVKSHIQRMTNKLEVKRRTQAVAKAKALGVI